MSLSDSLVSTKVRPPEARPKLVARPRLTERLNREAGRRLTLLCAPAGFGKTTLINEWLESRAPAGPSVAWVSLDEGDNDPARFLSYLVAALRTVERGMGEGVLSSLRSSEPPRIEALADDDSGKMVGLCRDEICRGPQPAGERAANYESIGAPYGCGRARQRVGEMLRRPRARRICVSVKDYAAGVATGGKHK